MLNLGGPGVCDDRRAELRGVASRGAGVRDAARAPPRAPPRPFLGGIVKDSFQRRVELCVSDELSRSVRTCCYLVSSVPAVGSLSERIDKVFRNTNSVEDKLRMRRGDCVEMCVHGRVLSPTVQMEGEVEIK